jgi:hypothetical protein
VEQAHERERDGESRAENATEGSVLAHGGTLGGTLRRCQAAAPSWTKF